MDKTPEHVEARLSKVQRLFLAACPADGEFLACQVGMRNWASAPNALARKGVLTAENKRPWDSNATSHYRLTEFGQSVRAILEAKP